jgi:hypothetical protein
MAVPLSSDVLLGRLLKAEQDREIPMPNQHAHNLE